MYQPPHLPCRRTADGVWVVEESNWTGRRYGQSHQYKDLRARADLDGPASTSSSGRPTGVPPSRIYIGETDDLRGRLDNHNANKDFWNRVIAFTSKDENLNKAHIRGLWNTDSSGLPTMRSVSRSRTATRVRLHAPPHPMKRKRRQSLANMLLIYPVFGLTAFERQEQQPSSTTRLHLKGLRMSGTRASRPQMASWYLPGRRRRAEEVDSIHAYGSKLRIALVEQGVLDPAGRHLVFTQDYTFSSPSQAAMTVLGRSSNGRVEWKTIEGKTLKELQTLGTALDGGQELGTTDPREVDETHRENATGE